MNLLRIFSLLLLSVLVSVAQPFPPVLRNAWSTNAPGTPVKGVNDLSVTNFTTSTATQWNFYGVGPNTIARLTDVTNIATAAAGAFVHVIQSNGVTVTTTATNLDFVNSTTLTWLMTNSPDGHVHLSASASGTGGGGETNWLGDAGTTNATRIGLADGKSNNTNLLKTVQAGNGVVLTNNAGGTNVMFAIDPAVVASQTDLNSASNVLRGLVGETNWNGNAGTTNATRIGLADGKSNNTNLIKTLQGGNGIILTNETGGTNVVFAIDPSVVASQTDLNNASNSLRGLVGETNWVGDAGTTNATRIGLADGKSNNTNLIKTLMGGVGIFLTNNVGGTNVMIAVDPVLANLIGTVANNVTNVVSLSTSNAVSKPLTNSYTGGVLTLKGIQAGANITITDNASNYVIASSGGGGSGSLAVQTNRVNLGTETNLNFITGNAISILATNMSGTNDVQFTFTPFIDITSPPYSAKGDGVTDDTAAFQAACNIIGANIAVPYRTNGYLVNTITLTNGITMFGAGGQSKIILMPGLDAQLFRAGINANIVLKNLELDGTNNSSFGASTAPTGNRIGVSLFSYGNNKVINLNIHGFGNSGILIDSTNTSSSTTVTLTSNNVSVTECDIRFCFYGVQIAQDSAEYIVVRGTRVYESGIAYISGSASTLFVGCEAFLCGDGFRITGLAANDGHGSIVGSIINHNSRPLIFTDVGTGYLVTDCQIWQGTNVIMNSAGIQIEHCMGSLTRWDCTNTTGQNWVRDNVWYTTYGNTIARGATDRTIFTGNLDNLGNVIGDQGFFSVSNAVFQGNASHTNATGTNFISGYLHSSFMVVTNGIQIMNKNATSNYVWTATNSNGEGEWRINPGTLSGETNWNGNAGTTNATRIGLADGKSNNTNLIKTVQAGNGLVLTNEVGGTNVVFAIDPAVVASQSNLTSASNFLYAATSNNVTVAAGAGSFVATNSSGDKMVYTVSSVTNAFIRLPVQGYLPGTNPPAPGLDQGTNQTWRMLFDDSTNETAYYQFTLPDRYFTNANLMISWSVLASVANKSNVFKVACMVIPAAGGTSVNVDSYNATNSFTNIVMSVGYVTNTVISCNIGSALPNDFIKLKLWREGADAFDNNSGDTAVHSLLFEYDEKKP